MSANVSKRTDPPAAWPVVWSFILVFLATVPLFIYAGGGPAWPLSLIPAAAVAMSILLYRMKMVDYILLNPPSLSRPEPSPAEQEVKIRTEIVKTENGRFKGILYGTLDLNEEQTRELGEAIMRHDVFVRSIMPKSIPNHTGRFAKLRDELIRLGLLDKDQKMTDQGLDYFARFSPTLAAVKVPANGHRPTTTDDDGVFRAYAEGKR